MFGLLGRVDDYKDCRLEPHLISWTIFLGRLGISCQLGTGLNSHKVILALLGKIEYSQKIRPQWS